MELFAWINFGQCLCLQPGCSKLNHVNDIVHTSYPVMEHDVMGYEWQNGNDIIITYNLLGYWCRTNWLTKLVFYHILYSTQLSPWIQCIHGYMDCIMKCNRHYTLSHSENDHDVTGCPEGNTLQDASCRRQSQDSLLNAWDNTHMLRVQYLSIFLWITHWHHGRSHGETKYSMFIFLTAIEKTQKLSFVAIAVDVWCSDLQKQFDILDIRLREHLLPCIYYTVKN